jgi:hypothetical protein
VVRLLACFDQAISTLFLVKRATKGASNVDPLADLDVSDMTVEAIAEAIGKTARGVKTMLTRRGLTASDYDGAAKAAKASSNLA